ncbi:MAG: hypothetical protein HOK41_05310 [Nitrospina sp.]|jgi:hypothetical protein|nr:hypothetical protein [Nitrospina sp.]MBT6717478.1 hypothetical protein [Nitrospina sp.]
MARKFGSVKIFLEQSDSVDKMIKATKKGRPALEPVIPDLMKKVKVDYDDLTTRQQTGIYARQVMETKGYKVKRDKKGKNILEDLPEECSPFSKASTYIKI